MRKISYLLSAIALLAFLYTRTVGARTEPPFTSVRGAFFALSVAGLEASAVWYAANLGLAVEMPAKYDKTSVIVLSGNEAENRQ